MAVKLYGMEMEGISEADLVAIRSALPKALAKAMKAPMQELKRRLVREVGGGTINVQSGRTLAAVKKAKIKTYLKGNRIVGRLTHKGTILNILEHGATIPATTVRPKNASGWLKFGGVFAKKVELPARTIPARPITKPAIDSIRPILNLKLAATVERLIAQTRAAGTRGDAGAD